jgi:hypothetical protein
LYAKLTRKADAVFSLFDALLRADLLAYSTANALVRIPVKVTFEGNALRIVAPSAGKVAALEKHCCAQSWPVLCGHTLYI